MRYNEPNNNAPLALIPGAISALPSNPWFSSRMTVIPVCKPLLMMAVMIGILLSEPVLAQHPSHAKCGANGIFVLDKRTNKRQCVSMTAEQRQKQTRLLRDKTLRLREMKSQSPQLEKELRRRQSRRQARRKTLQMELRQRQLRSQQQSRRRVLDSRRRRRDFQQQQINKQLQTSKAQQQQQLQQVQQPAAQRQMQKRKQVRAMQRQTEALRSQIKLNRRRVLNQPREQQ